MRPRNKVLTRFPSEFAQGIIAGTWIYRIGMIVMILENRKIIILLILF